MNSIVEEIYNHSINDPYKLCIIEQSRKYNYIDFFNEIKKYANSFKNIYRIDKGDCVIVECVQSIEYFLIEFAIHLIGGIFVPLEAKCIDAKIIDVHYLCKSKLIILKNNRNISKVNNTISYNDLSANLNKQLDDYIFPDNNSISEILFSTGTTGKEKGIVLTHKNDIAVAENIIHGVSMKKDNIEIMPLPINHSHGLRSCYANFLNGSTLILFDSITNISFLQESLDVYKANSIDLVPSALSILLKLSRNMLSNYSDQIRYIEFGSAALLESDKQKIQELLPNSDLFNFYGSTESGRTIVYNFKKGNKKEKCIGKPTYNVELAFLDENNNVIKSSIDNVGKIAVAGDMNMLRYCNDEEETKKAFVGKYIVSNDLAYLDDEGDVILLGREDDVINIGGKKVSPEEIESVTKQIKDVEDCACVPISDETLGQTPKLFVQLKRNKNIDIKEVKNYLSANLEKFKVPNKIEIIDVIPRTFNGKINRKILK